MEHLEMKVACWSMEVPVNIAMLSRLHLFTLLLALVVGTSSPQVSVRWIYSVYFSKINTGGSAKVELLKK